MVQRLAQALPDLYETDETAWLDAMAELIGQGRLSELDYPHLQEFLADMARRDRRQVENRLTTLLAHLLKWQCQPEKRSGSWRATISEQRLRLNRLLGRGVLRNHAEVVLAGIYQDAAQLASEETGLARESFPQDCPYSLDDLLTGELA